MKELAILYWVDHYFSDLSLAGSCLGCPHVRCLWHLSLVFFSFSKTFNLLFLLYLQLYFLYFSFLLLVCLYFRCNILYFFIIWNPPFFFSLYLKFAYLTFSFCYFFFLISVVSRIVLCILYNILWEICFGWHFIPAERLLVLTMNISN